jgi:hypothetical protein
MKTANDKSTDFITRLRLAPWFMVDRADEYPDGVIVARFHGDGIDRGVVMFKPEPEAAAETKKGSKL